MTPKQIRNIQLAAIAVVCIVSLYFIHKKMKKAKQKKPIQDAVILYNTYKGQKETDANLEAMIYKMWRHLGWSDSYSKKALVNKTPWSAAFVSWTMRNYPDFPKSAAHSNYIVEARNNTKNNTGNWKLRRLDEYTPKVGDIVCANRGGNNFSYDTISKGAISHCDVVTKVSANSIETIGGNVSNSISKTVIPLVNGRIQKSGYFAIIENEHNKKGIWYAFTGTPKLKRGSRGELVQELQRSLNILGASPILELDGIFGEKTENALLAFTGEITVPKERFNHILN